MRNVSTKNYRTETAIVFPSTITKYTPVFRFAFAIRNLIVAGISFLLFVQPLFLNYLSVIVLVVDFCTFVFAFFVIARLYLNVILLPFAWKAFLRPFIVYETIIFALNLGGLL